MFFELFYRYRRQIIVLVIALIVAIIAFIGYQLYTAQQQQGKVATTLKVLPNDATVTINGSQNVTPGTIYLKPGMYTILAHKDGFQDFSGTLTIPIDTGIYNIQLQAVSAAAKQWVIDNQALYLQNERDGATSAAAIGEAFQNANPIVKNLPYNDPYFSIGYTSSDNKTIQLTITGVSAMYRYQAIQKIFDWGYNPADFKINYTNYVSPLH